MSCRCDKPNLKEDVAGLYCETCGGNPTARDQRIIDAARGIKPAQTGAVRIDDPLSDPATFQPPRSIDDASGEEWNAASRRVRLDAEPPKQGAPVPAGYGAVKSMYSAPNGDVFIICDYGVLRVDGDRLVGLAP